MPKTQLKLFSHMAHKCAELAFYECAKYRETGFGSCNNPAIMELSTADYNEKLQDFKNILQIKGENFYTFVDVNDIEG